MRNGRRTGTILGCSGIVLLLLFWIGGLAPERSDRLLSPYGLFVWLGILLGAIALPSIAGLRGPRWWFVLATASVYIAIQFFVLVMS